MSTLVFGLDEEQFDDAKEKYKSILRAKYQQTDLSPKDKATAIIKESTKFFSTETPELKQWLIDNGYLKEEEEKGTLFGLDKETLNQAKSLLNAELKKTAKQGENDKVKAAVNKLFTKESDTLKEWLIHCDFLPADDDEDNIPASVNHLDDNKPIKEDEEDNIPASVDHSDDNKPIKEDEEVQLFGLSPEIIKNAKEFYKNQLIHKNSGKDELKIETKIERFFSHETKRLKNWLIQNNFLKEKNEIPPMVEENNEEEEEELIVLTRKEYKELLDQVAQARKLLENVEGRLSARKPIIKPKQEPIIKPEQVPIIKPKQEPIAKPKQECCY